MDNLACVYLKRTGAKGIVIKQTTHKHITRLVFNASTSAKVIQKLKVQNISFSWQQFEYTRCIPNLLSKTKHTFKLGIY